ncbi:flavin reductase family protein, partial [Clostridium botulinum]
EIEAVYVNEECMTDGKPDPLKINPLMMMGSNYYDLSKTVGTLFKTGLEILPK